MADQLYQRSFGFAAESAPRRRQLLQHKLTGKRLTHYV
jgi:hypothetical protein